MFWVSRQSRILSDRFLVFFLPGQSRLVSLLLIYCILYNYAVRVLYLTGFEKTFAVCRC